MLDWNPNTVKFAIESPAQPPTPQVLKECKVYVAVLQKRKHLAPKFGEEARGTCSRLQNTVLFVRRGE